MRAKVSKCFYDKEASIFRYPGDTLEAETERFEVLEQAGVIEPKPKPKERTQDQNEEA
jgi:hypothetical protein